MIYWNLSNFAKNCRLDKVPLYNSSHTLVFLLPPCCQPVLPGLTPRLAPDSHFLDSDVRLTHVSSKCCLGFHAADYFWRAGQQMNIPDEGSFQRILYKIYSLFLPPSPWVHTHHTEVCIFHGGTSKSIKGCLFSLAVSNMYFLEDFTSDGVIRSTYAIFIFPSDFSSPTDLSLPTPYADLTFYLSIHLIFH